MTVYVVRILSDGSFANSQPCVNCIHLFKLFQVKKVVFSNGNGGFEKMRIRDLEEMCYMHTSKGNISMIKQFGNVITPQNFNLAYTLCCKIAVEI